VPVPESDVRATLVAGLEFVEEQSELVFGGEASAFDYDVFREIIVGGHDRPILGNLQWDRPIESANLDTSYESAPQKRGRP
jgi:hypothetical protein